MRVFHLMVAVGIGGVLTAFAGDAEAVFDMGDPSARLHIPGPRTMSQEEIKKIFGPQAKRIEKKRPTKKEKAFQNQRNNASLGKQKPRKGLGACMRTIAR